MRPKHQQVRNGLLERDLPGHCPRPCAPSPRRQGQASCAAAFTLALALITAVFGSVPSLRGQTPAAEPSVPDAPEPLLPRRAKVPPISPCQLKRNASAIAEAGLAGAVAADPAKPYLDPSLQPGSCPPLAPFIDWYARFLNGPQVMRLTPTQKAWLATRDVIDPFNAITILGNSAIYVGANSHSDYGPGMAGFGKNIGVSYTQDITAEFFGTFLIPSLTSQDPHYHRMPSATVKRRIAHALYQVVWTQGDDGNGMLNYSNILGFAIDDEIGNIYVPGQQTRLAASARRYAFGFALAPIDNFITEFAPDFARRIHVRVVLVQRIINRVATTDTAGQ